ncbi:ATP-binding cassette domain-containing protein [Candidatus Bathyarchaeota archaeon]|nr:ATP-binding cassette domain-containing protein [Candidatus Bathyarchaeota archaeon]
MAVIKVDKINKSFGKTNVLKDISFNVEKGDFYGLFGPNGAGKTTLLRVITGQLLPDSGQAYTAGVPHTNPIMVKKQVGIVPEADTPPTFLTARETLELTCRIRGVEDFNRVDHWLGFFDITDKADVLCRDLSKGQRQKVMLASAFIHMPDLLLVDEPFINLDPIYQRKVREYLRNLVSNGCTVFMCTHILEIAEKLCNRIAVINKGRIVSSGSIDELREGDEGLEEIFLRVVDEGEVS